MSVLIHLHVTSQVPGAPCTLCTPTCVLQPPTLFQLHTFLCPLSFLCPLHFVPSYSAFLHFVLCIASLYPYPVLRLAPVSLAPCSTSRFVFKFIVRLDFLCSPLPRSSRVPRSSFLALPTSLPRSPLACINTPPCTPS